MAKDKFHIEFTEEQILSGEAYMLNEISAAPTQYQKQLIDLFLYYWEKFKNEEFAVDGATFIEEEDGNFFNIWWFIHDARNAEGYVSKVIDNEMIDIMTLTNTPAKHLRQAIPLLKLTWINRIRHFFKGTLKYSIPKDLIKITA